MDPANRTVHVEVAFMFGGPPTAGFAFNGIYTYVQPEATNIRLSDSFGPLSFTVKQAAATTTSLALQRVLINLRHDLLHGHTTKIRLTFDLGGAPRSSSSVRVGQAFVTFSAWLWGDAGKATSKVKIPAGYVVRQRFGEMSATSAADGSTILSAAPTSNVPGSWTLIEAEREAGYASKTLSLGSGMDVVVQGFPEDLAWNDHAAQLLPTVLPAMRDATGLAWPLTKPLIVRERFEPHYAISPDQDHPGYQLGLSPAHDQVAITESLDDLAVVSQVAGVWFSEDLFTDRWVDSGLAQEYAAMVLSKVEQEPFLPGRPDPTAPGFQPLNSWVHPGDAAYLNSVRNAALDAFIQQISDREQYGAAASWYVMDQIVAGLGQEKMKTVLAAAAADRIAYVGAGAPETVGKGASWTGFLDLLEERGASANAEKLFTDFVLTGTQAKALTERATARMDYQQLVADGHGWLPSPYIRSFMGQWNFRAAEKAMKDAHAVLDLSGRVDAAASALGVKPGPALKTAYEGATTGLGDASALGQAELDALKTLTDTRSTLDAHPDLFGTIGLVGQTPEATYAKAKADFEGGDLTATLTDAAAASAIVTGAPDVGRQRLAIGAGIFGLVVLTLLGLFLIRRRRRRARAALALAAHSVGDVLAGSATRVPAEGASPTAPAPAIAEPEAAEPYATLAADPPALPGSTATSEAGVDGG